MSEMIERVAKAMAKADADNTAWKLYVREARTAIEAMREPTDEMCQAYLDKDFAEADTWGSYAGPIQRWRAMIDAALSPSP